MRSNELTKRNLKELLRDPMSLATGLALPVLLLFALQALGGDETPFLTPTLLVPGIVLFGFVMLMFSSALILSRDRESALLARLLTTPLRARDFVVAYSVPYVLVAVAQATLLFALGAFLGLEINGSAALVVAVLLLMSVLYIGLGVILGSLFTVNQVAAGYTAILLLTIFGGTWFDLAEIGGVFETVGAVFPFVHALDSTRAVMLDGAGLGAIATDLYWVIGYTVSVVGLAVFTFRGRMVE